MSSLYLSINAWQEILARIFDGFEMQKDANPDWLINPATNRRLKLARYYPQAGVAVHFADLAARGQRRQSDWEQLESEQRDQIRVELCRNHDVQLAIIMLMEDPIKQVDNVLRCLSRASRVLAQGERSAAEKAEWIPALSTARSQANKVRALLAKDPDQMIANFAESWRDRESGALADLAEDGAGSDKQPVTPTKLFAIGDYANGQRVRHSRYGDGTIADVEESDDDTKITVIFDDSGPRNFLLSLVADKLEIIS